LRVWRRRSASGAIAGAFSLFALLLSACQPQTRAGPTTPPTGPTFSSVLTGYNAAAADGEASTRGRLQSGLVPLELVSIYMERARLTGDYDDYARAEALLARIEADLPASDGLCLAKARLHYALHRLTKAAAVLDGCPRLAGQPEELGLRADIAFHSGRYREASEMSRALVNQVGTPQTYVQRALHSAKTGAPGEALAFLEAAEKRSHGASPMQRSWFALQRGIVELERGRLEEARALFALADERLPGYWLNEEHLAEVAALNGDDAAAKRTLDEVVRKTGAPEYLDALSALEAEAGRADIAARHLQRAEAIYEARAKRFPEAIAGHALDHYLSAAPQPEKAMSLALANFRNRANGDAAVGLAKAYLLNDRAAVAVRLLEQQISRGWDTAETYWILSVAAKATGNEALAGSAAAEAMRRNPRSPEQYAFGT
jgi:Tfp pilus assembly protein PilF